MPWQREVRNLAKFQRLGYSRPPMQVAGTPSLSQLVTARRPLAAVAKILLNWLVVLVVFLVVASHPTWPYLLAGFLVIGIEQHALGLWMHEGVHWLIAKNESLNDLIVTVFLSGPLFVPLQAFRRRHFVHHGYLGTSRDTKPVIFTRVDGRQFWYFLLCTCLGLQLFAIAKGYFAEHAPGQPSVHGAPRRWLLDVMGVAVTQCFLLFLLSRIVPWTFYLWLWVLPWLTINRFIAGLRSVIEHQPFSSERHPFTRTLRPTLLDRVLFCRVGFQYHWAHHRYPNIPCFNLPLVDGEADEPPASRRGYLETLFILVRTSPQAG